MWSVRLAPSNEERDSLLVALWEQGTAGIVEEAGGEWRAFFEQREAALAFADSAESVVEEPVHAEVSGSGDWEPIFVGERFAIVPRGATPGPDCDGRIVLPIEAAAAFGSGRHESTQLCLTALEHYITGGETVVDIGCGSGILALAAERLGAGKVVACDIDEQAVRTARLHYGGALFRGSADGFEAGCADIVVANISSWVVDRLAADLRRIVKTSGLLIISGFLDGRVPEFFTPDAGLRSGEWLCWICSAENISAAAAGNPHSVDHPLDWWP